MEKRIYRFFFKDGDNNEIKVFRRKDVIIQSVKQLANLEHKTEKEIYYNYGTKILEQQILNLQLEHVL